MQRVLYPPKEAADQLGISLTTLRALMKARALRSVKVGRVVRVPADALYEYVQRLDADQNGADAGVAAPTPAEAPIPVQS